MPPFNRCLLNLPRSLPRTLPRSLLAILPKCYTTETPSNDLSNYEKLRQDLKSAMRTRDTNTLNPLKSFLTAHQSSSKDVLSKKPNTTKTHFESDIFLAPLLHKQIAKRRDSLEGYKAHGRDDLAEKEAFEITVLERYLPHPQTREDDVKRMTVETIEIMRSNGDGPNDPGNTSLNKIYEYIKRDEENREALSVLHADQGMVRRVIAETVRDLSDRIDGAPQRNVERLKPVEEDTLTKGRYQ